MSHIPVIPVVSPNKTNNNDSLTSLPTPPSGQDKVVAELAQVIGRPRAQTVSQAYKFNKVELKSQPKEVVALSSPTSKKSDPTGKQEETEPTKKFATLRFPAPPAPFDQGSRQARAMSIFTPAPSSNTVLSPQFKQLEVKRFSHSTSSFEIKPVEEFGKSFCIKTPIHQLKEIFAIFPLNEEHRAKEIEKKARALVYVCANLFEAKAGTTDNFTSKLSKEKQEQLFIEISGWIFSEETKKKFPEFVTQCIDILLEFSHAETAAPFLCELAEKMRYEDFKEFATHLYKNHAESQVFLKHTLNLFTRYDLPKQEVAAIFRDNTSLSTKLCAVCLEIILEKELKGPVDFLSEISNPKKYYDEANQCLTVKGLKFANKFLDKVYALNLSSFEPYVLERLNTTLDYYRRVDLNANLGKIRTQVIRQMLFLSGINQILVNKVKPTVKAADKQFLVKFKIVPKVTKLLQAIANDTLYETGSNDVDLNPLITQNKDRHAKFVARFY